MKTELPKKLLIINDMSGVGRCSITVALPIVSACKVQAIPVPTSIFSNHTGFPTFYKKDLTDCLPSYFDGLNQIQATFDGIYCGYLGSLQQISVISEYIKSCPNHPLVIIDPVMGDDGSVYSTITPEFCQAMKAFLSYADIITPNLTEACFLTDTPYPTSVPSESDLYTLAKKLQLLGAKKIVITGVKTETEIQNFVYDTEKGDDSYQIISSQITGQNLPGTGDVFASIVSALALRGFSFPECISHAADFVATCVLGTKDFNLDINYGPVFEPFLGDLFQL